MIGQKNLERIVKQLGIVNEEIYPTNLDKSTDYFNFSSVYMSDFDHNAPLEKSIIYSTSTGGYADQKTHWISDFGTSNTPLTYATAEILNNNYMSYGLMYSDNTSGHVGQFVGTQPSVVYNLLMSERFANRWNNSSIPDYFSGNCFITGFKYHALMGVIHILCHSFGYSNIVDVDFDTFFNNANYSNYVIDSVYLSCRSGTPTSRTSSSIQPFRYNQTSVLTNLLGNVSDLFESIQIEGDTMKRTYPINPSSDTAKSKYQASFSIIPNYSMYGATGNSNVRGIWLFGREWTPRNISYVSSSVNLNTDTNKGYQFHNSQLANWENMLWVHSGREDTFEEMYHSTRTNQGYWKPSANLSADDVLRMCATVGIIFTTKETHGRTADMTMEDNTKPDTWGDGVLSDDTYFPKKTSGYWQGAYTHGADNMTAEQIQDSWNTDKNKPFVNGSDYGSDEQSGKHGDIHTDNSITVMPNFNNVYVVTSDILRQLSEFLNNSDDSVFDQILKCLEYAGSNPINSVQAILHLPIGIRSGGIPGYNDDIILGRLNTKIKGRKLSQMVYEINMGSTDNITKKYNNYLDYAPYTNFIAWIPYCGFVDLDPNVIYDKSVSFTGFVDVLSGSLTVDISVNGVFYKTVSGSCATPIPLQAFDTASYIGGVINSAGSMGASLLGTAGGVTAIATGNVGMGALATISGVASGINALYDFNTAPQNFVNLGGSSSGSAMNKMPRQCGIFQYSRQPIINEESYSKIGRACSMCKTLNDLKGFTQIGNPDVSGIVATDEEKTMLKTILENGIYIH